jgi:hypothetical protein
MSQYDIWFMLANHVGKKFTSSKIAEKLGIKNHQVSQQCRILVNFHLLEVEEKQRTRKWWVSDEILKKQNIPGMI